jgi:hypothetical protein
MLPSSAEDWPPPLPLTGSSAPRPFPLDVLPDSLAAFAREASAALNVPVDFVAVPMLAVAGGAIGNSRLLKIKRGHTQPALLYTCIVGEPGTAKTPALDCVTGPLIAAEQRLGGRVMIDDTTAEALVDALRETPRGLVMVQDELAAFIRGMDQYRGGKGTDRQTYLKLWSQVRIRIDRKGNAGGAPVTVHRPFLALVGGIQTTVVPCLRGEARRGEMPPNDGMLDRFLFSYPDPKPAKGETWDDLAEDDPRWQGAIDRLLGLEMAVEGDQPSPVSLALTECGRKAWERFTRKHADEVNGQDFPEHLRNPWSKLRGYCARLALILYCLREACSESVPAGEVDGAAVDAAARLVEYFKSHAKKVLAVMEADRVAVQAERVLQWVRRKRPNSFKPHELFSGVRSQGVFPNLNSLEAPLARLVDHHYLRVVPPTLNGARGRPAGPSYQVNPALLKAPENPENHEKSPQRRRRRKA